MKVWVSKSINPPSVTPKAHHLSQLQFMQKTMQLDKVQGKVMYKEWKSITWHPHVTKAT
jgi:hypothetical protein